MKIIKTISILLVTLAMCQLSCNTEKVEEEVLGEYINLANHPKFLHQTMHNLTSAIVNDKISPPLASRFYVYPSLAAYEILRLDHSEYKSLKRQIRDFEGIPLPDTSKIHVLSISATTALMEVAKATVYTPQIIEDYQQRLYQEYKSLEVPQTIFDRSVEYGKRVAQAILKYSETDHYKESRTLIKYTVNQTNESAWKPTPPEFLKPIEPNWNTILPMVLDSAAQFAPEPPTPYDMDKKSQFYKELIEVYEAVNNLTEEQAAIAEFWDCNPFAVEMRGHLMEPTKKISPGGHWMGIARMAAQQSKADMMKSAEAYVATSVALFDAFISCWDEKYRSNLIRPETVINQKKIDLDWKPLLQTPPFPEYTSGHSVISSASAIALTQVFGENFAYVDSVEVEFGLPPRSYSSFVEASEEAAISRLYGGIHYMPAIKNGMTQGRNVGNYIFENIKLK